MPRRPHFRDQTLSGILWSMARAVLAGSDGGARVAAGTGTVDSGETPATTEAGAPGAPLVISMIALIVVIVVSVVVLARVFSSSSQPGNTLPSTGLTLTTPVTGVPGVAPLVVPQGVLVKVSHVYGTGPTGGTLLGPEEAVRGRNGLLYVADTGNHRIAVFNRKGTLVRSISAGSAGKLQAPFSLALTATDHLLVLDSDTGLIDEYDAAGTPVRVSSASLSLVHARGIALSPTGQVLVADPAADAVVTLGSDLTLVHQQPARTANGTDLFEQPSAVAVGQDGSIYVVDSQNNRLVQFTAAWQPQHSWPLVTTDTQHSPRVLPLPDGTVLVSDPRDGKLLLFDAANQQPRGFNLAAGLSPTLVPLGISAEKLPAILVTLSGTNQVWEVRLPALTATTPG